MIHPDQLPLRIGTTVLVTAANTYSVPISTLAVVAGHVTTNDDMNGWPIIAYPDEDPDPDQRLQISVESWAIEPAAITVVCQPPHYPTTITPEVAAHVLWHYNGTGYRPGTYTRNLIATLAAADHHNLRRLAHVVPDYAEAVRLATQEPDGLDQLQALLRAQAGEPND